MAVVVVADGQEEEALAGSRTSIVMELTPAKATRMTAPTTAMAVPMPQPVIGRVVTAITTTVGITTEQQTSNSANCSAHDPS